MAPSEQSFQYGISYMQPRPAMPPHNRPTHAQPYPPATFNMQLDPVLWSGTQPSQVTSFRTQPSQATSFGTLLGYAQTGSAAPLDLSAPSHLPSYQAMDFGAPTSEATQSANQQPANLSGPSTSTILKCPKCDATFSDKKAMKTHDDTVHICKEKKAC
ncbi:hypothetical protein BR93DRAFT_972264 [Coniochaeta sp. PMI_546]|nr:hypothetical protein BR93DRAFT_972264 [Coniochaeta sp. PMI_546]